jgi:hypothetical protein
MLAKVIEEPDLVRDANGVIHNNNTDAYREYMVRRQLALETLEQKQRITDLENKIDRILRLLEEKK